MDSLKKNDLLSICIPTYNRAKYLDSNLNLLLPICEKYKIPICISDNCSTDSTKDVIRRYQRSNNLIEYSRNDQNLGIDANMDRVIKMSNTKYCWLFSDDDTMYEKSIPRLLELLDENEPDFILLSHVLKNLDDGSIISEFKLTKKKIKRIDSEELLTDHAVSMTLLSACVINRVNWLKCKLDDYDSSYYYHIYNVLTSCYRSDKIYLLGDPFFDRFHGNDWNFKKKEISLIVPFYFPSTIHLLPKTYKLSLKKKSIINKSNSRLNLKVLYILRMRRLISITNFPWSYLFVTTKFIPIVILALITPAVVFDYIFKKFLYKKKRNWH